MERVTSNSSTTSTADPETLKQLLREVLHESEKIMKEDQRQRAKVAEYQDVLEIGGMGDSERAEIEAKMTKLRHQVRVTEDHIVDAEKDLELVLIQLGTTNVDESTRGRSTQRDRRPSIEPGSEEAEKLKQGLERVLSDTLEVAEEQRQAKKGVTPDTAQADEVGATSMRRTGVSTTGSSAPASR